LEDGLGSTLRIFHQIKGRQLKGRKGFLQANLRRMSGLEGFFI